MIDIELIRKDKAVVIKNLAKRGVAAGDVEEVLARDEEWRGVLREVEKTREIQNQANKDIAQAGKEEKARLIKDMQAVAAEQKQKEREAAELLAKRDAALRRIPNLLAVDVPEGGENDFTVIATVPEEVPTPSFTQKSYLELLPSMIDLERAGKVSGSRFVYVQGQLARLELGLVTWVMDRLAEKGFMPLLPPVLINELAMAGMGYLDRAPEEIYKTQDGLYLVGTSEQAVGPMHRDEMFAATDLPRRYVAFSTCFRREAGSHGKDVKGMLRLHQFDKVEMFSFTTPKDSEAEHEFLVNEQQEIMNALELPYRVIKLAAQDTAAPAAKTYDIETWMPSEGRYRETHSTSNTTDFQARRLNIRVKDAAGGVVKVHMLNGTAVAVGRTLIALIENHQQADGSIGIPAALHPYLPFTKIAPA